MIEEERERRARLQALQEAGVDPYPARVSRTHTWAQFLESFENIVDSGTEVSVVGRVRALRKHGGLSFLRVEDGTAEGQVMVRRDDVGEDAYTQMHATLDVGDFVEVTGGTIVTKTGESSVLATRVRLISKALMPLPEKWHGLTDIEKRFRHRSLDLISNKEVRQIFIDRAKIVSAIRAYYDGHGFIEVETPILQHVAAGASAKPFVTHHNALDQEMYLRIAPELFLKRLVVGGYERVYEIARCFRNEGMSPMHNPEFTQVEAYIAYTDYEQLMDMMEEMVKSIVNSLGRDASAVPFEDHVLDFSKTFPRRAYADLIKEHAGVDIKTLKTAKEAIDKARSLGVDIDDSASMMTAVDEIWKTVRGLIIQPTFVVDYPSYITPLAKRSPEDPDTLEMFQLLIAGGEVMKAFTELNDPIDQEARLDENEEAHKAGDEEAQRKDDDFLYAMKHGMPPMAGMGMGIDRLTRILTNSSNIKEVILFPTLRAKHPLDKEGDSEV